MTFDARQRRTLRVVDSIALLALAGVAAVVVAFANGGARHRTTLTVTRFVLDRPVPMAVTAAPVGRWTPAIGQQIADRARRWLGWPYSFAGGDAAGPTYGKAVDRDSRNDGRIRGFDCSGLVLYALAPWLRVDHLASAQYLETGTVHPAIGALQPGDLIFWSEDGTVAGVGHVAVYVGNGSVVQAPHSGGQVEITPLDEVESGTIGTVRPLS